MGLYAEIQIRSEIEQILLNMVLEGTFRGTSIAYRVSGEGCSGNVHCYHQNNQSA